ncbi:hypothetical protein Tco_0199245 [Tanacetum coccineum]
MLCKPKSFYDEVNRVVIGYKNLFYLSKAKQVQPALYNGYEIVKTNHAHALVHDSKDTLEIVETTRKQMIEKMKDPECAKKKAKALKEKAKYAKPITAMMVYPPYTPAKLTTPTGLTEGERGFEQTKTCYLTEVIPFFKTIKEHFEGIQTDIVIEIKEMEEVFNKMEAEVDQHAVDKKFSDMHDAYTAVQKRIAELEAENSNLTQKIQKDDHDEMIKHFYKLEIKGKMKCITMHDLVKPKVLTPGMYAIDVEPIPPRNRYNREVHLNYLKHLKESVGTLCKIVEEAMVEKILESSLASACLYTKHSHELLEYVIGTCPKDFNNRDRKIPTVPLHRKKRVTFVETCETLTNKSHTHVEQ